MHMFALEKQVVGLELAKRLKELLYRTLLQVMLPWPLKRLPHRLLSLERTTNPEGVGDA